MKKNAFILLVLFGVLSTSYGIVPNCPTTSCSTDCGSSGSGCMVTQYDNNGDLCSTTTCNGKRGNVD